MSSPPNFTDKDSRRRRLPWQVGQSEPSRYCATRFFISALWVVAKVCSTYFLTPMNVPM